MLASGAISEIAGIFLSNDDFDTQLNKALVLAGKRFDVSRGYFFIDPPDGLSPRHSGEWCAEGAGLEPLNLESISCTDRPFWKKVLEKEWVYAAEAVSKLPAEAKKVLEPQGSCSLIMAALRIKECLIGFIGFDVCGKSRAWTDAEIEVLKSMAGIISIACSREFLAGPLKAGLETKQNHLMTIIEGARLGTWEWDIHTGVTIFNERWAEMLGYTLAELSPTTLKTWEKLIHPDDYAEAHRLMNLHFQGISDYYECEKRLRHKNGSWVWILACGRVIERDSKGDPVKMYGTHRDITEKKIMEQQIRELSIRDSLTGVYNRRYVFERLDGIIAEYSRCGRNFCLSLLDIDHLKEVNDMHGQLAGDFVLKEFALTISSTIRQYDLLGRFGGEEFIVITTSAKGSETAAMIERVMKMIRGSTFIFKGQKMRFTFSGGVADSSEFSRESLSAEGMIALADKRLSAAKNSGRDRCFFN